MYNKMYFEHYERSRDPQLIIALVNKTIQQLYIKEYINTECLSVKDLKYDLLKIECEILMINAGLSYYRNDIE
jgi:hypothetical protein